MAGGGTEKTREQKCKGKARGKGNLTSKNFMKKHEREKAYRRALSLTVIGALTVGIISAFCGCSGGLSGVSAACVGYAAGEENATRLWHEEDRFYMPVELVRAFWIYTVKDRFSQEELYVRLIYDYDTVYAQLLLERTLGDIERTLHEMNEKATALGLSETSFGSVTGQAQSEESLRAAMGEAPSDFQGSLTCLRDCFILCRLFADDQTMRSLLGSLSVSLPGTSERKRRSAPLLNASSELYIEDAVLSAGGWTTDEQGKNRYVTLTAVEIDGRRGCSAVGTATGDGTAVNYAACDGGNLCGKVLGKEYKLTYAPYESEEKTGLVVGRQFFAAVLVILLVIICAALVLLVIAGAAVRFRRNYEGRKKYAPPKSGDRKNQ